MTQPPDQPASQFSEVEEDPGEAQPGRNKGVIITVVVAAVLVLGAAAIGLYVLLNDDEQPSPAATGSTGGASTTSTSSAAPPTSGPEVKPPPTGQASDEVSASPQEPPPPPPPGSGGGTDDAELVDLANRYGKAVTDRDEATAASLTCDKQAGILFDSGGRIEVTGQVERYGEDSVSINIRLTIGENPIDNFPLYLDRKEGVWCVV